MQDGLPIAQAKRDWNLFVLDFAIPKKIMQTNVPTDKYAMMTTGQKRPIHLVNRSIKVQIWHKMFGHTSNTQIIGVLKLLTGIGEFGITYNLAKIYSNSKASKSDNV